MSNRNAVMHCIAKNPSITLDEIVEQLGKERKHAQWTINDCKTDGLIEVVRDDVTGKPAYRLTDKGKAWLVNRPAIGEDTPKPASEKPAQAVKTKPQAKNGKRYFYLFDGEGFDTPEEACEMVMHEVASEDMRNVRIVSFDIVGRIEVKPTLVLEQ